MNETRLAKQALEHEQEQAAASDHKAAEIRVLDELELVLAAGGDHTVNWP
jgi:hypothetical protein